MVAVGATLPFAPSTLLKRRIAVGVATYSCPPVPPPPPPLTVYCSAGERTHPKASNANVRTRIARVRSHSIFAPNVLTSKMLTNPDKQMPGMPIIYLATSNPGKVREFREAAEALTVALDPLPGMAGLPPAIEDGVTFEQNARIKAEYYSRFDTRKTRIGGRLRSRRRCAQRRSRRLFSTLRRHASVGRRVS